MGCSGPQESTLPTGATPVLSSGRFHGSIGTSAARLIDRSVIERLEKMRRGVLADPRAERRSHLGAVAPVHPAPDTRVAFLGMNVVDARVVPNRAAVALERQRELIGAGPH